MTAWRALERDLAVLYPEIQSALQDRLLAAGEVVAADVRRRIAAEHGSGRMLRSVKVRRRGRSLVSVVVEARDPRTNYRYPGRVHFDESRRHSDFLYGAAAAKGDQVADMLGDAIEDATKRVLTR